MDILTEKLNALQQDLTRDLARVLRIRSVREQHATAPFGEGPRRCLLEALTIAEELGFRTVNMQDYCGYAEWGQGDEMVMVLGHLDVVPEGEGWLLPPYGAQIQDGRLYGRGATDDKGPLMAALYGLKAVVNANIPLKRRVRIVFGCAEETGSEDMAYYRDHGGEKPVYGFTPDAEYPLIHGEKGIVIETWQHPLSGEGPVVIRQLSGGTAANVVPDKAFAVVECAQEICWPSMEGITVSRQDKAWRISAEGRAAHGSVPEQGKNALGLLALYLHALPLTGDSKQAIAFLAEKIGLEVHGESLNCCLRDEESGFLSNNWGVAQTVGGCLQVTVNYRYPVTFEAKDCVPAVHAAFEKAGWHCLDSMHEPKLYTPREHPLIRTLLQVYQQETGDMRPPRCIGGGTYAKALPNIVAYGPIFPGDEVTEHLPNEYITLDNLYRNMCIYARAIVAMANM